MRWLFLDHSFWTTRLTRGLWVFVTEGMERYVYVYCSGREQEPCVVCTLDEILRRVSHGGEFLATLALVFEDPPPPSRPSPTHGADPQSQMIVHHMAKSALALHDLSCPSLMTLAAVTLNVYWPSLG